MSELIDTKEMYLKTVFELIEEGIPPMRARIAERLGHSGPTVSQTVARLERDGLMVVTSDRHLRLTEEGQERATRVMRKHRLAERLLADVIGLDWVSVHDEACRWEHVMSDDVERRLIGLLGEPRHDPFGNPIPGLKELSAVEPRELQVTSLADHLARVAPHDGEWVDVRLERIGEPLQVYRSVLVEFFDAGIAPPTPLRVQTREGEVILSADDAHEEVSLDPELVKHLFIRST